MKAFALLSLFVVCAPAAAQACANPVYVDRAVVKIHKAQGSGWFVSPTDIVTVAHVTAALPLSSEWSTIILSQNGGYEIARRARVKKRFETPAEEMHVIELAEPLPWRVQTLVPRTRPLTRGEKVMGSGYTLGDKRSASGTFVDYEQLYARDWQRNAVLPGSKCATVSISTRSRVAHPADRSLIAGVWSSDRSHASDCSA